MYCKTKDLEQEQHEQRHEKSVPGFRAFRKSRGWAGSLRRYLMQNGELRPGAEKPGPEGNMW